LAIGSLANKEKISAKERPGDQEKGGAGGAPKRFYRIKGVFVVKEEAYDQTCWDTVDGGGKIVQG